MILRRKICDDASTMVLTGEQHRHDPWDCIIHSKNTKKLI